MGEFPAPEPARATAIADRLLAHYRANKRDLPWRHTRDPYAIWVSEIMLQQTRVATVIPYYQRWLERFPDARTLSEAPLDDVLELWSGLGYYSRARNLHRGAREVVARYGGKLPRTADELRAIPGIGRYTAGAIASIAHEQPAALVDGNVARVYARLFAIEEDVKSSSGQRALWALADALVPAQAPGDYNQALMELGATVCTPTSPGCDVCPVAELCAARASGRQDQLPVLPRRKRAAELPQLAMNAAWIQQADQLLVVRRRPEGLYGGLWELPQAAAKRALGRLTDPGIAVSGRALHTHQQVLSHRRLRIRVYRGTLADPGVTRVEIRASESYDQAAWRSLAAVTQPGGLGISSATRAIAEQLATSR